MAYTINLTNGTLFATIPDGTINTNSSMTLVGKNYAGYGQFLDDNFIHLLENSSDSTAPATPLVGQLWWDSTNKIMFAYNGTGWKGLAFTTSSSSAPASNRNTGDLWWDTTNSQLNVWDGTQWYVIGPAYTPAQGVTGAIPLSILATNTNTYLVTGLYSAGQLVGIFNPNIDFTPNATQYSTPFPIVFKGFTSWQSGRNGGNVVNSGNVYITAGGQANAAANATIVVTTTGSNIVGYLTASGTMTAGNVATAGTASATGNITGGNVITVGLVTAGGNITGANVITGGLITATANITGGNILTAGQVSATGNVSGAYFVGNIIIPAGQPVSTTGNITGGNIIATTSMYTPDINHTGTNAVGNIGSSTSYFNQVFATATTALYADVAERFAADDVYEAGTVVELGGTAEITKSQQDLSDNVFGVISTRAAYLMNGGAGTNETHPPVAMTGRVPVQVIGQVSKGDRLVSAGNGLARSATPGEATAFNTIGRALANKTTTDVGLVEAIVTIK